MFTSIFVVGKIAFWSKSKQTILVITPPAKLNRRDTVLSEFFLKRAPINPPRPVPTTPDINVVIKNISQKE